MNNDNEWSWEKDGEKTSQKKDNQPSMLKADKYGKG